jgi:hypothetical protein
VPLVIDLGYDQLYELLHRWVNLLLGRLLAKNHRDVEQPIRLLLPHTDEVLEERRGLKLLAL